MDFMSLKIGLQYAFLIAFFFPFVPHVFDSDLQPFFIVLAIPLLFYQKVKVESVVVLAFCIILSFVPFDSLSIKVALSLVAYVLIFEIIRNVELIDIKVVIVLYYVITIIGVIVFTYDFNSWAALRDLLGLRNADYHFYGQLAPEPSILYIHLAMIFLVCLKFRWLYGVVGYLLISLSICYLGNNMSLLLLFIPLFVLPFVAMLGVDRVLLWGERSAFGILGLYCIFFLYGGDYLISFMGNFDRSEQVRLYDIGQAAYAFKYNWFGCESYDQLISEFAQLHPQRFERHDLGSTSALSSIVYSIGALGLFCFLLIVRKYFKYTGLFLIGISSTIGLSWLPLVLLGGKDKYVK